MKEKPTRPTSPRDSSATNPQPSACSLPSQAEKSTGTVVVKSEEEWRRTLTPEQFRVLREHGTEPPFRNAYWDNKSPGLYLCAGCGSPLFGSAAKFDSRTGWPSFWNAAEPQNVGQTVDHSYGMTRVEAHCQRCGGHLGHLFEDGPQPTGLRYCINSASIAFVPQEKLDPPQRDAYADHVG